MTGEWEYKLRQMEHGKFPAPRFHGGDRRGHERHRRAHEKFRGGRLQLARHRHHLADRRPADGRDSARLQIAGRRPHDLQSHERPQNRGRRKRANSSRKARLGPLDGFVSAKTGNRFPSKIKIVDDEKKPGRKKAELDFGNKVDVNTLDPFWTDPATGAELCEAPTNYVLREKERDGEWKETFKARAPHVPEARSRASGRSSS